MTFKEFLLLYEMPQAINNLENDDDDIVKKCKKFYDDYDETNIPYGGHDYTFTIYKGKNHHGMALLITDDDNDDEFIGYVKFTPGYKLKNSINIQMTEIISDKQGEGIATDVYKYLLKHFDHIVSDDQLTDGSISLYKKLAKTFKPQILIKGNINSKEKSEQENQLKDIDFTNEKLMKEYDNRKDVSFVLSKK